MKIEIPLHEFLLPLELISSMVNEVIIKVEKNRITLTEIDPANVAIAHMTIMKRPFWNWDVDKTYEFGLNIANVASVLSTITVDYNLTLSWKGKSKDPVRIEGSKLAIAEVFEFPITDIVNTKTKMPKLGKLNTKATIPTKRFQSFIRKACEVGYSAQLYIEGKDFVVSTDGDLGSYTGRSILSQKNEGGSKSRYSLEYLKIMAGLETSDLSNELATHFETVTLEFAKDYPLHLTYNPNNSSKVVFILAPRIE